MLKRHGTNVRPLVRHTKGGDLGARMLTKSRYNVVTTSCGICRLLVTKSFIQITARGGLNVAPTVFMKMFSPGRIFFYRNKMALILKGCRRTRLTDAQCVTVQIRHFGNRVREGSALTRQEYCETPLADIGLQQWAKAPACCEVTLENGGRQKFIGPWTNVKLYVLV
jgi:hypothetical protein